MKKWKREATPKSKLVLLFKWIKENDNSEHPTNFESQEMTPRELVECYGEEIIRDLRAKK